jgi:hypothetical protein
VAPRERQAARVHFLYAVPAACALSGPAGCPACLGYATRSYSTTVPLCYVLCTESTEPTSRLLGPPWLHWLLARKSPSPQPPTPTEGVFSFQYNSQYSNSQYNSHAGQKSAITEFRTFWGGVISRLLKSLARNHPLASPLLSAGRWDAAVWASRLRSGNFVWCHVLHMCSSTGCRLAFAQVVAAGPKRIFTPLYALLWFFGVSGTSSLESQPRVDLEVVDLGPCPLSPVSCILASCSCSAALVVRRPIGRAKPLSKRAPFFFGGPAACRHCLKTGG